MKMRKNATATLVIALAVPVGGCLSPPPVDERLAAQPTPKSWSRSGGVEAPDRWWEAFGDPDLNVLVQQVIEDNLDVKTALARLEQARAVAGISRSALFPSLDAGYTLSESDPANPAQPKSSVTLSAGYEIDLWGRNRQAARASRTSFAASAEDVKAAAITVEANIAGNWYELVGFREKLRLLREQQKVNEQYLELLRLKFGQGKVPRADVLQQEQEVVAKRSEIAGVKTQIELREHTIAVLLGRAPKDKVTADVSRLPELPPMPDTGIPASLLRKRPDIMAAEYRVRSANHSLGEAIAARFPRLSLSASGAWQGDSVGATFDNWMTSLAANLLSPIFDAGRRKREVERNRAVVEERLAAYRKTVLGAFKEAEDALTREAGQAEHLRELERQVSLGRQLLDRQRTRYLNGQTDYLSVMSALRSLQKLESRHVDARKDSLLFRIELYRALGGGWEAVVDRIGRED